MKILLDADAIIGLFHPTDAHHKTCKKLLKKLDKKTKLYITWDVIDESTTKLSYKLTKKHAINFLQFLKNNKIKIIYPDQKLAQKSQNLFAQIKSKKVSLTDCTNIAVFKQLELDHIFSFDKIYPKNQVSLLESAFKKNNKV